MLSRVTLFFKKLQAYIPVVTAFMLTCLAWFFRFMQDDAYISFRYARNFSDGLGLVFNPGEPVEGYTNFLWTLCMSVPIFFGEDPALWSQFISIILYFFTLLFAYDCAVILIKKKRYAFWILPLLGLNYSFLSYATGGMETQLQTCLTVITLWFCFRILGKKNAGFLAPFVLSLCCAMLSMTRLDSTLFVCFELLFVSIFYFRKKPFGYLLKLILAVIPYSLAMAGWLYFKLDYYGDVLPNTYYAKAADISSVGVGADYVFSFFHSYMFYPLLFVLIYNIRRIFTKVEYLLSFLICISWVLYLYSVGDFMEYRFFIPFLPLFFLLALSLLSEWMPDKRVWALILTVCFTASFLHYDRGERMLNEYRTESIAQLEKHLSEPGRQWIETGRLLQREFDGHPGLIVACGPCGAIPFFSGYETVDMYGLNDAHIARFGRYIEESIPGHQRYCSMQYLLNRKVHVLFSGLTKPRNKRAGAYSLTEIHGHFFHFTDADIDQIPASAMALEIPIDDDNILLGLVLKPTPWLQDLAAKKHWMLYPFS